MSARVDLICATNQDLVIGFLLASKKKGPGWVPRIAMKLKIAATGQSGLPVRPRIMSEPRPNWSYFDFFR